MLDYLKPGSIVNHRAFFLNDYTPVEFKAVTNVKILRLDFSMLS